MDKSEQAHLDFKGWFNNFLVEKDNRFKELEKVAKTDDEKAEFHELKAELKALNTVWREYSVRYWP